MRFICLTFLSLFLLTNCTKEDFNRHQGTITKMSGPESVQAGTPFVIEVTFNGGTNGCAVADEQQTAGDVNGTVITAFYKTPKAEQICTMVVPVHSLNLSAKFDDPGTYHFTSKDGTVSYSVAVTQ